MNEQALSQLERFQGHFTEIDEAHKKAGDRLVEAYQANEKLREALRTIYLNTLRLSATAYSLTVLRTCESVLTPEEIEAEKQKL